MRISSVITWILIGAASLCGIILIFRVLLVFTWTHQSGSTIDDYFATHHSAKTRLPVAVEFESLFPGETDHFVTQYGFNRYVGDRTNTWNSEAYFAGRYSLTMQVEVVVDYKDNSVMRAGTPKFYLERLTE